MIKQFQLKPLPHIIFGCGEITKLRQIIKIKEAHPLFILSPTLSETTLWQTLFEDINKELKVKPQLETFSGEPSPQIVDEIVENHKGKNIDLVIAIGGGSVLDAGKAVSAMLCEKDGVTTYLEGVGTKQPSGEKIPFIAIPTTSGTGSETTTNAVISQIDRNNGFKKSLRHDNYIPNVAIIDPDLTLSCPQQLTVNCGMDTFTQLVEGYLSTNSSAITDTFAINGIKAIARSLETLFHEPKNLEARTDLAYASFQSGIVLANAGLGTVHGFASTIGAISNIPHGVVCGTLMAHANRLTLQRLRRTGENPEALEKYSLLGRIFGAEDKKPFEQQDFFIDELIRLSSLFQIAPLSDFGIGTTDIDSLITTSDNKYNPAQLDETELKEMLECRI